ncbi:nickel insertion protein [Methanopyrus sp. KOL6]|uniref:nickel insertion protein n=1 Tax=Methanopyrus sp. KOL6 TaxID=1937004 RepID=UPI000B4B3435|nr:nickel insertion protein [Methanopyrus sp. KOL6]
MGLDYEPSHLMLLVTVLDDRDGEVLGDAIQKLIEREEVLACHAVPCVTKKNRPGHVLVVLVDGGENPDRVAEDVARDIMVLTGSTGVDRFDADGVYSIPSRFEDVRVVYGEREWRVSVKIAETEEGEVVTVKAEFDECREIGKETGIPPREVKAMVEAAARVGGWVDLKDREIKVR